MWKFNTSPFNFFVSAFQKSRISPKKLFVKCFEHCQFFAFYTRKFWESFLLHHFINYGNFCNSSSQSRIWQKKFLKMLWELSFFFCLQHIHKFLTFVTALPYTCSGFTKRSYSQKVLIRQVSMQLIKKRDLMKGFNCHVSINSLFTTLCNFKQQ